MLEDELHQSAAGDTPPEPEAKESDAAVPAEETGSIPEKATEAEPAEGNVPPEPPKWKKVLQTAKKVVLKLPYPYLIMRIVGCYFMVMAAFLLINRKEIRGGSLNPVEKWEEFVDKLPLLPVLLCVLAGFVVLTLLRLLLKRIWKSRCEPDGLVMVVGVVAMAFQTIWRTNNYYYALAFIVVCTIIAWFAYRYGSFKVVEKLPKAAIYITIGVLMCLMGAFIAVFTIYRHKVYGSMAFDFGSFVQM